MSASLGAIVLAHQDLDRVGQLVRHLAGEGCAVSLHVDRWVGEAEMAPLRAALADLPQVSFAPRIHCEWGRFSLVQATLGAAADLLARHPGLEHVVLLSGSCLPIRPIRQLRKFLARHKGVDFIESVSVRDTRWVKDGLNEERFQLYFPVAWKRRRWLFDRLVELQRRLGVCRTMPDGLEPHLGSQWWCLTARTLRRILEDPRRPYHDRFFRSTWIPDESYFQTLVRRHSRKIEGRSLTFSRFDHAGRPFILYDDHLDLLPLSDCFFARKVWRGADGLYSALLDPGRANQPMSKADPARLAAVFDGADRLRREGNVGRFNAGRCPLDSSPRSGAAAVPYTVFVGFRGTFPEFPKWVQTTTGNPAFGPLFARGRVGFRPRSEDFAGNLPAEPRIRDRNPKGYLSNLLWMHRHAHASFLFEHRDRPQGLRVAVGDPMARVVVLRHGWLMGLLGRRGSFESTLRTARRLLALENALLATFEEEWARATMIELFLSDVLRHPGQALDRALGPMRREARGPLLLPEIAPADGLDALVRRLRNEGLKLDFQRAPRPKPTAEGARSRPRAVS